MLAKAFGDILLHSSAELAFIESDMFHQDLDKIEHVKNEDSDDENEEEEIKSNYVHFRDHLHQSHG